MPAIGSITLVFKISLRPACRLTIVHLITPLHGTIARLNTENTNVYKILFNKIERLGDLRSIYNESETIRKHELINLVFDSNLSYENGAYRTPSMINLLSHNVLKMKEKGVVFVKKRRLFFNNLLFCALERSPIEPLIPILLFLERLDSDSKSKRK